MSNILNGFEVQLYECIKCGAIHDEQSVGTCRVEGYEKLFCAVAGCKGDVKLHIEENENE